MAVGPGPQSQHSNVQTSLHSLTASHKRQILVYKCLGVDVSRQQREVHSHHSTRCAYLLSFFFFSGAVGCEGPWGNQASFCQSSSFICIGPLRRFLHTGRGQLCSVCQSFLISYLRCHGHHSHSSAFWESGDQETAESELSPSFFLLDLRDQSSLKAAFYGVPALVPMGTTQYEHPYYVRPLWTHVGHLTLFS